MECSKVRSRKIASVDQKTGEVLDGVIVYCAVKRNPYAKGWVMNSQEALELLASDKDLTKESLRILMFLMARLDFENWIQITQNEIAETLDINKGNVSKAISLLETKGILLRGPKVGRSYGFRLNPYFGWKGKVKNLDDYRQKENDSQSREMQQKAKLSLVERENPTDSEA
jgi:predicted transcriptional regulator